MKAALQEMNWNKEDTLLIPETGTVDKSRLVQKLGKITSQETDRVKEVLHEMLVE